VDGGKTEGCPNKMLLLLLLLLLAEGKMAYQYIHEHHTPYHQDSAHREIVGWKLLPGVVNSRAAHSIQCPQRHYPSYHHRYHHVQRTSSSHRTLRIRRAMTINVPAQTPKAKHRTCRAAGRSCQPAHGAKGDPSVLIDTGNRG
jgi:hypothetical protein